MGQLGTFIFSGCIWSSNVLGIGGWFPREINMYIVCTNDNAHGSTVILVNGPVALSKASKQQAVLQQVTFNGPEPSRNFRPQVRSLAGRHGVRSLWLRGLGLGQSEPREPHCTVDAERESLQWSPDRGADVLWGYPILILFTVVDGQHTKQIQQNSGR